METAKYQHYEVVRREDGSLWELGRGAMGVTYKAVDVNLRCPVALKVIRADASSGEIARQRFVREARAAAQAPPSQRRLGLPPGHDEPSFFYAMEFIDGETLERSSARRAAAGREPRCASPCRSPARLPPRTRQGLVHRDIKPANLMVIDEDEDGDNEGCS